jgi:16S rRNA (uracil1498-N3)-methyltransferase
MRETRKMAQSTRLYLDLALEAGLDVALGGAEAQYLGRVLRLRVGDRIAVFNGRDGEFDAELVAFSKQAVSLEIGERLVDPADAPAESGLRLHLVQGISRGERMDLVVQKATELGVKRVTPVLTQHGAVRFDDKRARKRRDHWERIAISAAEQCGRLRPPLIDAIVDLNGWLGANLDRDSTQLVLDPRAGKTLAAFPPPATKLCFLIGPEGGLSDKELEDAHVAGFEGVSFGPRILRTETAAIAAATLAQALFGDLGDPEA